MKFKVTLARETEGNRETDTVTVEADGATLAYCAAMKTRNHSEGWYPVGWEKTEQT